MKTLIVFLLLIGCSRPLPHPKHYSAPAELQPYITEFIEDSIKYGKPQTVDNLVIVFDSMSTDIGGTCTPNGRDTPVIRVNSVVWPRMPETYRRIVLLHELGHCILHREHKDTYAAFGAPASIMNTWIIDAGTFLAHENYYLNELFNP